jgi:hypothetical protein
MGWGTGLTRGGLLVTRRGAISPNSALSGPGSNATGGMFLIEATATGTLPDFGDFITP